MMSKAGAAVSDISPLKPMFLFGYPHVSRTSVGIHDPLYASALCIDDGSAVVMFIAVDVLLLSHETVGTCRAAISSATHMPPESILISTTHTHSAPATISLLGFRDDPVVPPVDPGYLDIVCRGIIDAGIEAVASAVPAQAALTSADARGVGGSRHALDGESDPEVGILFLRREADRSPLALSLVYSMHPTVLHEDSKWVSADLIGYARDNLRHHLPGVHVLYHTGPCGNQSPRYHVSGQTFGEAERLGIKLAGAVLESVGSLRDSDFGPVTVASRQRFVTLPGRDFPSVSEAETMLGEAVQQYERLKRDGAPHGPVRTAECGIFGAEERVTMARAQSAGELDALWDAYTPTEVQVLRVGPGLFVGLPGELFVEYGLDIKRSSPAQAFVISLANGELQGYIVTPGAGGYESGLSLFAPEAGALLVDAAVGLMEQMVQTQPLA